MDPGEWERQGARQVPRSPEHLGQMDGASQSGGQHSLGMPSLCRNPQLEGLGEGPEEGGWVRGRRWVGAGDGAGMSCRETAVSGPGGFRP